MPKEKTREVLTNNERIELQRRGTSDFLRIPAHWRRALRTLQGSPLIFNAYVEKDGSGKVFIVFEKVNP